MDQSFWLGTSRLSGLELNEGFGQNESLLRHLYVLAYSIFALDESESPKELGEGRCICTAYGRMGILPWRPGND